MAFLSASKDTKSEEPRFAEATHVFCTHFDPLHGSTLDLLMSSEGLVYNFSTALKSSDPAMLLMHKLSNNLEHTSIISGAHTQTHDLCYSYHQGCFALFCYRGETGKQANRNAVMFSVGLLFGHGDMLLFLERGLVDSDCAIQIKKVCDTIYSELVRLRDESEAIVSPLDLGSELKEHLRPLLGARLLMRPQLFRPHQDQRLVEEFDESTLAIVRAGLLLGLRVGIAAHPPVKHIVDIIGTLAMLSITTTFNDHILLSPQTVTKAASHDGHKNKKNARRVERQGKVVVSPKRKSFQTTQLKNNASGFFDDDCESRTAPGDLLSDTSDNVPEALRYTLLPRLLGHIELHSLAVAQQTKINRPFLFLDPTESGPENVVHKLHGGPVESRLTHISQVSMFNYLWSDADDKASTSLTLGEAQTFNIAFNGVIGISTEISQLHEMFDIVILMPSVQTRQLQLTPSLIHPYLVKTRLSNVYVNSKLLKKYKFLTKASVQGTLGESMTRLCDAQKDAENVPFLICTLNARLFANIRTRLEQGRRLTKECFKGTGLSGSSNFLHSLAKYWFTDRFEQIEVHTGCPCIQ
ncbi:hypothetical protein GL50803_007559 [Giardia duodenalis]|uniref:Uncharacterized protein n=1 Tax=Giardia intestinalis (strain ATCC 50803 / WB clone C6) TaxID=184922 RepID=A8BES4_GIAIC|nr:hypothetical protein GL50803_007559 [Giardia intestinalis]KAE8305743.1 hypothetical protein GL50803_007559 [Giardia intestinalis]|eukprot:XP_001707412.1 Hypothetical protein GL50803_7559 [Giardia lamblia ATCC 50803]